MKYENGYFWVHSWWQDFRDWRVMFQVNPLSWVFGIAYAPSVLCLYLGPLCLTVCDMSSTSTKGASE